MEKMKMVIADEIEKAMKNRIMDHEINYNDIVESYIFDRRLEVCEEYDVEISRVEFSTDGRHEKKYCIVTYTDDVCDGNHMWFKSSFDAMLVYGNMTGDYKSYKYGGN